MLDRPRRARDSTWQVLDEWFEQWRRRRRTEEAGGEEGAGEEGAREEGRRPRRLPRQAANPRAGTRRPAPARSRRALGHSASSRRCNAREARDPRSPGIPPASLPPCQPPTASREASGSGYGSGSVATGAFGTVPGLMLLPYLTDSLGIAAILAGFIVFLPKAWDVILNPIAGRISDRTVDPRGPRRPWLLRAGVGLAVGFALLFAAPEMAHRRSRRCGCWSLFVALRDGVRVLPGAVRRDARRDDRRRTTSAPG